MRFARLYWVLVVVLVLAATAALADHHANGKWVVDVALADGQGGQATLELEELDTKLSGTYTGALGTVPLTGDLNGEELEISFESQAGKVTFKGKVSGDTMEGTCDYGQLGKGTFKGKKAA
jgi:hypothetical protein